MLHRQAQVERLAETRAALRRVATLVARGVPPATVLSAVAEEVGRLLGGDATFMGRFEPDETVRILAAVGVKRDEIAPGSSWNNEPPPMAKALQAGRSVRVDDLSSVSGEWPAALRREEIRSVVVTPIVVEGQLWGAIGVGSRRELFAADAEQRMAEFTELIATAIANAEASTEVTRLAAEQAALRRVATLVARESPSDQIFAAVAEEVGRLLNVDDTVLVRFEDEGAVTVLASWGTIGELLPPASSEPAPEDSFVAELRRTGRPCRSESLIYLPELGASCVAGTPIVVQGRLWGAMLVLSHEQPLPPDTEDRVGEFTELVATAIANVEARSELASSRGRIVQAADEQRRRVVRDLHDGAQARLVHSVIALKRANARDDLTPDARSLLEEGLAHATEAIAELRELVSGIHPAILTSRGLAPAVELLADRVPVPVEIAIPDERFPAPVESAAYFVAAEALTNVVKYAGAARVRVEASRTPTGLRLVVEDDGVGGAETVPGHGLAGLVDRLEALGGDLGIESRPDAGTRITAEIPC
jgi:signal transduction histidine kinase